MFFVCVGQLNLKRQIRISQPTALCSVSACPKPDELPFSTVVPLKRTYEPGEQIVFSCQPGYVSRGGIRRFTCPLTGLWPINTLKCMRKSASFPTFPAYSDPVCGGEMTDLVQLWVQKASRAAGREQWVQKASRATGWGAVGTEGQQGRGVGGSGRRRPAGPRGGGQWAQKASRAAGQGAVGVGFMGGETADSQCCFPKARRRGWAEDELVRRHQ